MCGRGDRIQRLREIVEADPGPGRDRYDGRSFYRASGEQPFDVVAHERDPVSVGEIRLRYRHHTGRHTQKIDDREVLPRLRHHAVVRGDDEQDHVDARGARHHVSHEPLMPRDVDNPHAAPRGQRELGEPELDGHPARLLLGQTIGIGACQRFDQRGLAVIDVPGSPENEGVRHALRLL